jgi:predicted nucleic acid-binding protein
MLIASPGSGRSFVDTNVFGYAHDPRDPAKHEAAIALLDRLSADAELVVSTQVVNELCAILLRGKLGGMANRVDIARLGDEP